MEAAHPLKIDEKQDILKERQFQQMILEVEDYTVLQLDQAGIVQARNQTGASLHGYEIDEIIGQHFSLFYSDEDQQKELPQQLLEDARKKGSAVHLGWRVRKDKGRFWSKIAVTALGDALGKVNGFIEMTWDLTHVQKKAQEIQELNVLLENKLKDRTSELEQICSHLEEEVADRTQELQAFSYSVSHDLKAPLRAITGYSAILLEDYKESLDDEGKHVLSIITRNVDRMNQLIQEVLQFSRLNRRRISRQSLDMKAAFMESYEHVRASENTSRSIDFQMGNLPTGYGDREMISQVTTNLISNALKYTRPKEEAVIQVKGYVAGKECLYTVQDNGVGFDERYKDKLFEIFQRLHKESEFEGAGMGLAMVQQIIRKHGGKVWGEGKPNQGAIFYFTLPLAVE